MNKKTRQQFRALRREHRKEIAHLQSLEAFHSRKADEGLSEARRLREELREIHRRLKAICAATYALPVDVNIPDHITRVDMPPPLRAIFDAPRYSFSDSASRVMVELSHLIIWAEDSPDTFGRYVHMLIRNAPEKLRGHERLGYAVSHEVLAQMRDRGFFYEDAARRFAAMIAEANAAADTKKAHR